MKQIAISDALYERLHTYAATTNQTIESIIAAGMVDDPPTDKSPIAPMDALELAADAVIAVDADQRIVRYNAGAEVAFRYKSDEVIGQPLDLLLPADATHVHRQHLRTFAESDVISRHMAKRSEVKGRRKDGTLFPIEVSILKYVDGSEPLYVAILRDTTLKQAIIDQLREFSTTLKLLTDHATDMICLHEPNGTYIFVSPASFRLLGYAPEDMIGTDPYTYIHPDDVSTVREAHSIALSNQTSERVHFRLRHRDGHYIWLETFTNNVHDDEGNFTHIVSVSRDISDRQRIAQELQAERDLLSRIMDTSPSGITVVDHTGQISFTNRRSEEILGTPRDEMTNLSFDSPTWRHTDYDGNPWPDEKQPFIQVMATKAAVWDVRHAIQWSSGETVYLTINGAPILDEDGEVSKVVFTVEDYTERKHQQDALEAALEREKQLNQLKSSFLSMVSHEFRTPLAVITTSADLLRMKFGRLTQEEFRSRLDRIITQVNHLDRLLREVTFINKSDQVGHKANRQPVNLPLFFEQLSEDIALVYPDHRAIKIIGTANQDTFNTDEVLLQQICNNLIGNAVKYSPDESDVICSYSLDDTKLRIVVSDQGIGIPREDQGHLFDEFHRAGNVGTVAGSGLGLAIVQRAVHALMGTITYESEVGVGTRFIVTLPVVS